MYIYISISCCCCWWWWWWWARGSDAESSGSLQVISYEMLAVCRPAVQHSWTMDVCIIAYRRPCVDRVVSVLIRRTAVALSCLQAEPRRAEPNERVSSRVWDSAKPWCAFHCNAAGKFQLVALTKHHCSSDMMKSIRSPLSGLICFLGLTFNDVPLFAVSIQSYSHSLLAALKLLLGRICGIRAPLTEMWTDCY